MANKDKGEVSVTIDGTSYTLVLNTAAMIAAEEKASTLLRELTWDELMEKVHKGSAKYVRLFLWAMFQKHHPEVTVERAGELIDAVGGIAAMSAAIQAGQTAATPHVNDVKTLGLDKPDRPRKAQGGRGTGEGFTKPHAVTA